MSTRALPSAAEAKLATLTPAGTRRPEGDGTRRAWRPAGEHNLVGAAKRRAGATNCGGGCDASSSGGGLNPREHEHTRMALQGSAGDHAIAAALLGRVRLAPTNDPLESEATHVAASIARATASPPPAASPTYRPLVHRSSGPDGKGVGLPAAARASFEPHFGRDLGAVHVHTGAAANAAAEQLEAGVHGR